MSAASQVFAVDNRSTVVSDSDVRTMILACNAFVPEVASAWSLPTPSVLFAKDISPVPANAWLFHIIDADPSEPGMLAYHEETNNVPDGYILAKTILQNGGAVLYAGAKPTVASALFHEIVESLVDPDCNSWWQAPNGAKYAAEIVDPVQGQIVSITVNSSTPVPTAAPIVQSSFPYNMFASGPAPVPALAPVASPPASVAFSLFASGLMADKKIFTSIPGDSSPSFAGSSAGTSVQVGLSDFIYPAWRDAGAKPGSRFSYSGVVTAPFQIWRGGYAIVATNGGPPTNVYGELIPGWLREVKEKSGRVLSRKGGLSAGK
jgi:hypothetical protein